MVVWNDFKLEEARYNYTLDVITQHHSCGYPPIDNLHCLWFFFILINDSPLVRGRSSHKWIFNSFKPENLCRKVTVYFLNVFCNVMSNIYDKNMYPFWNCLRIKRPFSSELWSENITLMTSKWMEAPRVTCIHIHIIADSCLGKKVMCWSASKGL